MGLSQTIELADGPDKQIIRCRATWTNAEKNTARTARSNDAMHVLVAACSGPLPIQGNGRRRLYLQNHFQHSQEFLSQHRQAPLFNEA